MELHRLQRAFAAHLRDPQRVPPPAGVEPRRMAVYRELFFNNVCDLLGGTFPACRAILGEDGWAALVRRFYAEHKARTPYFLELPREFVEWLAGPTGPAGAVPPFLAELAHYEWVELALSVAEATSRARPSTRSATSSRSGRGRGEVEPGAGGVQGLAEFDQGSLNGRLWFGEDEGGGGGGVKETGVVAAVPDPVFLEVTLALVDSGQGSPEEPAMCDPDVAEAAGLTAVPLGLRGEADTGEGFDYLAVSQTGHGYLQERGKFTGGIVLTEREECQ